MTRRRTSTQATPGIRDALIPARWWNSVRTQPGHRHCTRAHRSVQPAREALGVTRDDYALLPSRPSTPGPRRRRLATLDPLPGTAPLFGRATAGSDGPGCHHRGTLTSSCAYSQPGVRGRAARRRDAEAGVVHQESTGRPGSASRSATRRGPLAVAEVGRQDLGGGTYAAQLAGELVRAGARFRATSTRSCPRGGELSANPAPMPAVGPVTRAVGICGA